MGANGFKKFRKDRYDDWDDNRRKTPRHRPNKEQKAIYADVSDQEEYCLPTSSRQQREKSTRSS